MSYLVLARKWRPTRFDDVVGQRHVTQTLQNAIRRERIPHALLFIGSRGIGKTSCARILAKALNCQSETKPVPTPCEECTSCLSINQGNAVDVFEIDGASNNGVEQVRELRESTRFQPGISRFKIYIIDEVHMLSVGAFNALLKTLEEPPPHVKFIFATTEPHKIPDTIISRCQRFDFKRIRSVDIVDALEKICQAESVIAERAALEHVAREAQGGMRDSLSLLDQLISFCGEEITESKTRDIFGLSSREMMLSLIGATLRQDAAEVINLLGDHAEAGADLKRLSAELLELLRDLMVIKVHSEPHKVLSVPPSELEAMIHAAQDLQVGAIHHVFQTLIQRADEIQRSAYPKLVLEMALMQMCHQADTATLSEVMNGLLSFEQHLNEIGLNAGLPPLSPPPQYRPPADLGPRRLTADQNMERGENPSKNEGFNEAQPPATTAASMSERSSADTGRSSEPSSSSSTSSSQEMLSTESPLNTQETQRVNPQETQRVNPQETQRVNPQETQRVNPQETQRVNPQETQRVNPQETQRVNPQETQRVNPQEAELSSQPELMRPLNGLPKHPPLPADPHHIPQRAEGMSDLVYEWMTHFNRWLAQLDSFVASEMRIKMRFLHLSQDDEMVHLTWGAPEELLATFQEQYDVVRQQLALSANTLGPALFDRQISTDNLHLTLSPLPQDAPEYQLEALTEYAKRKIAIAATKEIVTVIDTTYIKSYLESMGGQVVYVIPQSLNR